MNNDRDEFVQQVIQDLAALPDGTEPNTWPHRQQILSTQVNGNLWAKVCLLARGQVSAEDKPVNCAMFLVETANGMRRQTGLWDIETAFKVLDQAKAEADQLPESGWRNRVLELWRYNTALVHEMAGNYEKESELHVATANSAQAAGDKKAEAQALYMGATAYLKEAIVDSQTNTPGPSVKKAFQEVRDFSAAYQELLDDSPEDLRWRANVACTLALYNWLLEQNDVNQLIRATRLIYQLEAGMQPAFGPAEIVIQALDFWLYAKHHRVFETTKKMPLNAQIDWRLAALLLESEVYGTQQEYSLARGKLEQIVASEKTEHGGKVYIAIAKHRLKQWH